MSNRSLSASTQGQDKLRTALERRNLTQKSLSYEGSADGIAAWSTINRFFNGKPIQRQLFIKICDELNLDWQDIAEFPEEELTPLNQLWLQLIKLGSPTEDMGLVLAKEQTLGWGTKLPSRYEKSVSVGAYIQVEVNLNIQGYLLLLLKDTSGEVCCFCPSCFAPENKLEAGKTILPQADSPITSFPIEGTPGKEQILAIITPKIPNLEWLPKPSDEPLTLTEDYLNTLLDYASDSKETQILYTEYQVIK
ncbi:MAG: DUF4384 domain-containing protein [Rivularia sp. (in: Bacteria)]|nr:DUF4384 domain-containing protein [Rivularia sp. MS3]